MPTTLLCMLKIPRGNQNPFIEEQTTRWQREKGQKDKERSIKHTYKTKDRVTRTPLKPGGELMCSGRVSSSWSTSGTRRVNLVTNQVINHERGKDREVLTTSRTYQWPLKGTWKCALYEQLPFIYRLNYIHYSLIGEIILPFIDSDLLYRGAL
jgi:hypothetical protein